ncbi:MAG: hypothetical protein K2X81_25510 [Candidatus Obscuribacterales bacterium]|nr:hypothetical protein [Candidatus Obscuribacterales bacterium]
MTTNFKNRLFPRATKGGSKIQSSFLLALSLNTVLVSAAFSLDQPAITTVEPAGTVSQTSVVEITKNADGTPKLQSEVQITVDATPTNVESPLFTRLPVEDLTPKKRGKAKSLANYATTTTASLGNFIFDLRGFDFSKEGADVILGQKTWKGDSASEYNARLQQDKKELATIQPVMQIAASVDKDSAKAEKGKAILKDLLGEAQAQKVYDEVASINAADLPSDREKLSWDLEERKDKVTAILEKSASQDKVMQEITKKLEKFNHRSKTMQIAAKVAYSGLGIAAFSPTLVAPIAETALLAFMYATGGPEQDKLLRELYLSKEMQSRCDLTNEKAHLILSSMDLALLTNNKKLYAWSKELLASMTDKSTAEQMCSTNKEPIRAASTSTPEIQ